MNKYELGSPKKGLKLSASLISSANMTFRDFSAVMFQRFDEQMATLMRTTYPIIVHVTMRMKKQHHFCMRFMMIYAMMLKIDRNLDQNDKCQHFITFPRSL